MATVISIIGAIALQFAVQFAMDAIDRLNASKSGLTQDQIIARLNGIINRIQQKNPAAYNELQRRIAASPDASQYLSGKVRAAIHRDKKAYSEQLAGLEEVINEGNELKTRVSSYAYLPDSYKLSNAGKTDLANIEQAVQDYSEKNQTLRGENN